MMNKVKYFILTKDQTLDLRDPFECPWTNHQIVLVRTFLTVLEGHLQFAGNFEIQIGLKEGLLQS